MVRELADYLDWLAGHGVHPVPTEPPLRDPDHDRPLVRGTSPTRTIVLDGADPLVEHLDPAAGLSSDHATTSVARELLRRPHVRPDRPFWEPGCGTGVLSVLGARLGAGEVIAADLDGRAVALARKTAAAAGAAVMVRQGSLLDPFPEGPSAALIVANLPHKPAGADGALPLSQGGGPEGDAVHAAFVGQAAARLGPGGSVLFFLHSLPHPRLLAAYGSAGFSLRLRSWKRRFLQEGEFAGRLPDFLRRAAEGRSWMGEENGRRYLLAGVWEASAGDVAP